MTYRSFWLGGSARQRWNNSLLSPLLLLQVASRSCLATLSLWKELRLGRHSAALAIDIHIGLLVQELLKSRLLYITRLSSCLRAQKRAEKISRPTSETLWRERLADIYTSGNRLRSRSSSASLLIHRLSLSRVLLPWVGGIAVDGWVGYRHAQHLASRHHALRELVVLFGLMKLGIVLWSIYARCCDSTLRSKNITNATSVLVNSHAFIHLRRRLPSSSFLLSRANVLTTLL